MAAASRGRYDPRMVSEPPRFKAVLAGRRRPPATALLMAVIALLQPRGAAVAADVPEPRPVTVRVTWGGGKPRAWSGTIRLVTATEAAESSSAFTWQTLSTEPDAAAAMHSRGDVIEVHEPARRGNDGVELTISRWQTARIVARLHPDGDERAAVTFEATIADVILNPGQKALDQDGNRLVVRGAPGDSLRIAGVASAATSTAVRSRSLFRTGEKIRVAVDPLLPARGSRTAPLELRMRLKATGENEPIAAEARPLVERRAEPEEVPAPMDLAEYARVVFDVNLPEREAAYEIELTAVEQGGLRWSRPLAVRTIQIAAMASSRDGDRDPRSPGGDPWRLVHELDPGSPRLLERLRRLPAVGKSYMPLPALPLPPVSLPAVSLPNVPVPNVPVPKIPGVAIPSVSSIVPKMGGLLATGHSTVEPHPLGPMLRLPAARSADEPSWEGIVVTGAVPGAPHLVEVEFPDDQNAVLALTVLETDAAGTAVEARGTSGFEVVPKHVAEGSGPAKLGRHTFAFWPTTRHPLLVLANPSERMPALFGRVRVSTGSLQAFEPPRSAPGGRQLHAFVPSPDLTAFGGTKRMASGSGRCFADWQTFLAGARHAAEWLAAQRAAGSMWVVYRGGAAAWPSRLTRGAPRWDPGVTSDAGLDPVRKDLVELLCRAHSREGLRFLPALSFDSPLPAIESLLSAGGTGGVGITCIGRDGRPRQTEGGAYHYNILDPRVQQAVEDVVRELATGLCETDVVDGVALVMPHDGWMHLPGTAWCLDDATFGRFLADMGTGEPDGGADRFARRAERVEGPLRDRWLDWRSSQIARFHARLAGVLAEHQPRWSLHVTPTTLFSEGAIAARFRPALRPVPPDADLLREIGIDVARITADPRIVFVSPQVHTSADTLLDRALVEEANRSLELARGAAVAARRGVIAIEQPVRLSVAGIVPHGPFGTAAPASDRVPIHAVSTGPARGRALAESLIAADAEVLFDMGLLVSRVDPDYDRCLRSFAGLPAGGLAIVDELPAPLVGRTGRSAAATVLSVVNAGGCSCRAVLPLEGEASAAIDLASDVRLPLEPTGGVTVPLRPWEVRTLVVEGGARVRRAGVEYDDRVRTAIAEQLADGTRRRAVLETPRPLDVLDNPGFELAGPGEASAGRTIPGGVGGWELVEAGRGTLGIVPGLAGGGIGSAAQPGKAMSFSSVHGLSTVRSNPFAPPATGRVSVAVWLRIADGEPQPPLRLAVEGMLDGREYYRFAPVGGLAGGKPLTAAWSQFVLQVDDLPTHGLESLRVRFDLLGPGGVQIDGVRVFHLAFDEAQRVQFTRRLALVEQRLAADDLGACLVALDGHWPRFLREFVSDEAVAATTTAVQPAAGGTAPPAGPASSERSGSLFERVRRWWQ